MANFTGTLCGPLSYVFQDPTEKTTKLLEQGAIVVQTLPLLFSVCAWLILETVRQRRRGTVRVQRVASGVGVLAASVSALLIWRTFDLLKCDNRTDVAAWQIVAVVGSAIGSLLLLLVLTYRTIRLPIIVAFTVAGGIVFCDWCLRAGVITTYASAHLVAIQQLWCIQAVSLFPMLPNRRRILSIGTTKKKSCSQEPVIDSLARREPRTDTNDVPTKQWSWFW